MLVHMYVIWIVLDFEIPGHIPIYLVNRFPSEVVSNWIVQLDYNVLNSEYYGYNNLGLDSEFQIYPNKFLPSYISSLHSSGLC